MPIRELSLFSTNSGNPSGLASSFLVATHTTSGTADSETSFSISPGTLRFCVQTRDSALIRISGVSGFTSVYHTLWPGAFWSSGPLNGSGVTVYVSSPKPSQTLEIMGWV